MAACLPSILSSAASLGFNGHTPLGLAAAVAMGGMMGSSLGASFAVSLGEVCVLDGNLQ